MKRLFTLCAFVMLFSVPVYGAESSIGVTVTNGDPWQLPYDILALIGIAALIDTVVDKIRNR